jgi:predicted methyltransferase
MYPILSSQELRNIDRAIKVNLKEIETSIDLGKDGFFIGPDLVKPIKIRDDDQSCYIVLDKALVKVQFLSEDTGFIYKLIPTSFRPILQTSGTSMHKRAFVDRVEADKLTGKVLDAGTGLGYTAIVAAKTADMVVSVEIDPGIIDIARLNPYSQDIFNKKNINLVMGDLAEMFDGFKDGEFDFLILDVGNQKIFADFFSGENYRSAFRIMKAGGKLYHYIPRLQVTHGRDFAAEVIKRIKAAGFSSIERNEKDSYVVAVK